MIGRTDNIGATVLRLTGVLSLASVLCVTAIAETTLTPHAAEYKVKISVLGGQLNTELRAHGDSYVATHVIKATGMSRLFARGMITETSEFDSAADGVRPTLYRSDDTLSRQKTHTAIQFDWDTGEATGTVNSEKVHSVMDDLAYDRVSIQYELMHDLMNGGPTAQYTLFDVDELKTVNVRNIGHRTVKVPAGKFDAIGIQHQAVGSARITTLWCVKELDYLPVIIEQHRKGKLRIRATLKKYSLLGT